MADCFEQVIESNGAHSRRTVSSPTKKSGDGYYTWFSSSFPVLCNLLDKVHEDMADLSEGSSDFQSSEKSLKELVALFPPLPSHEQSRKITCDVNDLCIPVFTESEKFAKVEARTAAPSSSHQLDELPESSAKTEMKEVSLEPHDVGAPVLSDQNLCYIEQHIHHNSDSTGLLQLCVGSKSNVYRIFNNAVREMDQVILNPDNNICSENSDNFLKLKLPGSFSYSLNVKPLSFRCNGKTFDVFGVLLLIIDSIYALNCVAAVNWKGISTPLEFKHDIVKVIAVISSTFPKQFQDLQKLVMYSTVCTSMRKAPLKWNRCMVHVFEDLIVHPLSLISEDTVEFKLLGMIMHKRAKVLCSIFSEGNSSNIFNSSKHRSTLTMNFKGLYMEEIAVFLKMSALHCQGNHRVKNIRYELKDKSFRSILRDIFLSYC